MESEASVQERAQYENHDGAHKTLDLVAGHFGPRFYAPIPLHTHGGYNLGALCILAQKPRSSSDQGIRKLEDLAAIVMHGVEQRLESKRSVIRDSEDDESRIVSKSVGSSHGAL